MRFKDRLEAGRQLAAELRRAKLVDPVILALPRGGVPVGFEVARSLDAPLDVVVVRKIGAPFQPELGVGAVAEGGDALLDEDALQRLGLTREDLEETIAAERAELERRLLRYRGDRPAVPVEGRSAVVVDDGLATGGSARAALQAVRRRGPSRLVLAVPVSPPETAERLSIDADELVCLATPEQFMAVGQWYQHFDQTSDETVIELLQRSRGESPVGQ
ncbi:MAG: phosphoribosyltransferase [Actinomycetota bacterium]|nr:phosphoribosyltransferase [Actinomycetota bacterium]